MASPLTKRILSVAIIAPIFLYAIVVGGLPLQIWLTITFIISLYEWYRLSQKTDFFTPALVLGVIYMSLSFGCFLAFREVYSLNLILVFLGMIWSSDTGAYFVGKTIGGPKLIVDISPNKTWSGFAGALLCPAIFGMIWTAFFGLDSVFGHQPLYVVVLISGLLGVVTGSAGQAGDLLVSFVKRQAHVKDTGSLIPGHGGVLDRIDSTLLGAPVFLTLITLLSYVI